MNELKIRDRVLDLVARSHRKASDADIDMAVDAWRKGYDARMPSWCVDMLPVATLEQEAYRDAVLAGRDAVRRFLAASRGDVRRRRRTS